jgi:hypothetical protein
VPAWLGATGAEFAAVGGVAVQALLVVAALEHRASIGSGSSDEEEAAPSF